MKRITQPEEGIIGRKRYTSLSIKTLHVFPKKIVMEMNKILIKLLYILYLLCLEITLVVLELIVLIAW